MRPALRLAMRDDPHYARFGRSIAIDGQIAGVETADAIEPAPVDYVVGVGGEVDTPADVFDRLRWGGQFIYISSDHGQVMAMFRACQDHGGFAIDHGVSGFRAPVLGLLPLPGVGRRYYFMVGRRVALLSPGQTSDRFTFDVKLALRKPPARDYVVMKQVPPYYRIVQRLRDRFPDATNEVLLQRAEKLVERVFPVFLTREAAFLQLLQRDLPPAFRDRVPQVIGVRNGPDGLVHKLYMNWLRVGGEPLSQMEFARQSTELLACLHDEVRVMHLDLRLDNFVITPDGVGFVDFGSAVRVGENIRESPMLRSLFDEMMTTSQIQITLGRMKKTGRLTSDVILSAHRKVDKAVDLFYLALMISRPTSNPDLVPLIRFDPASEEARRIQMLTDAVLRPKNPQRPGIRSASDMMRGLNRIAQQLPPEE